MKVLVDIGNTKLKWACAHDELLAPIAALWLQRANLKALLLKHWGGMAEKPTIVAISCVANQGVLALVQEVAEQLWPGVTLIIAQSQSTFLGLKNFYRQPEKLGIDRWLALIAVRELSSYPVWVIDCGTAITIDYINAEGQHLGGVICPGLALMKQSLALGTEQLSSTSSKSKVGLANHTRAAIYSGTLLAAAGLIEKMISTQDRRGIKVYLTGGDAETIAAELPMDSVLQPDLVLRGLLAVVREHARA